MERKGQAAMEFLMTYGWAILAAIVVIGILGYYYFSSGFLTPSSAAVNKPFYLNAWNVQEDVDTTNSGIVLEIKNQLGDSLDVVSVEVDDDNDVCDVTDSTGWTVASGEVVGGSTGLILACNGVVLSEGDIFRGGITIIYQKTGSDVDLTSTGEITEPVVA